MNKNIPIESEIATIFNEKLLPVDKLHRFSHFAMATVYEILIYHKDSLYAKRASIEVFNEIDRLEGLFSRFIENSEISKINSLQTFESTVVNPDTFQCLQDCLMLYQDSKGVFDVSAGFLINLWKENNNGKRIYSEKIHTLHENSGMPWLHLEEKGYLVTVLNSKISLDLGGYGKGFALDKAAKILKEWDIECYMIHGGASSVLAGAAPVELEGWPVNVLHSKDVISIKNKAIGASGLQKGNHIIHPYTGRPASKRSASWVFADSAAKADALSTAFMLMPKKEIEGYCKKYLDVSAVINLKNGRIWKFNIKNSVIL